MAVLALAAPACVLAQSGPPTAAGTGAGNGSFDATLMEALRSVNAAAGARDRGPTAATGSTAGQGNSEPRSPGYRTVPVLRSNTPAASTHAAADATGAAPPLAIQVSRSPASSRATVLDALPSSLTLHVGQMVVVRAANVSRVAVGSGKVIEARVMDGGSMLLTALDAGDSTLHVWDRAGKLSRLSVRVNASDLERVADELRELTAGITGVTLLRVGEKIVLDGANLDPGAVARLKQIAELYGPSVVSLATADRIRVDRMVEIKVRILEFTKNALDDLGMRWQTSGDGFSLGVFSDIASNSSFRVLPEGSPYLEGAGANSSNPGMQQALARMRRTPQYYLGLNMALTSQINLQVQRGNAFLLASPNLSTRSGGQASFLAGGEIPLPAMSALGSGAVDFKQYGIRLEIKPIADGDGNISGNIMTEVSSIDPSVAVQGIPGLLTRRTETEFNVFDGETIVISGLVNRESSRASDGIPGLRRLPVLGRAFRADLDADKTQEVVVFLTPRVVRPVDSVPRIERALQMEQDAQRGFGNLTEDRSKPAEPTPVAPSAPPAPGALPPGQYESP